MSEAGRAGRYLRLERPAGAKPRGVLYIMLRNSGFARRTLESQEKVLSRRIPKIALAVVWRLVWRIREMR